MPDKPKHRRLRKVQVSLVSLVSRGANLQPALLKAEGGSAGIEIKALVKADLEGLLHALVYIPNKLDAHSDWMGPEYVRFAQHAHLASGGKLDLHHDLKPLTKEQAYLVEEFILQGQDARFPDKDREGNAVDHKGAWASIIKLQDADLLAKAKAGELTEVSFYAAGGAYEAVREDLPLSKTAAGNSPTPPKTMDETKLAEALAKFFAPITAALTALSTSVGELKKAQESPPKKEEPPVTKTEAPAIFEMTADGPLFKGDATNPLHMMAYRRKVEDHALVGAFKDEMRNPLALAELTKAQQALAAARKIEDGQLGLPSSESYGQSLRKQLAETPNGQPTMNAGTPTFMQPTDAKGFVEILGAAEAVIKSHHGKIKGESVTAGRQLIDKICGEFALPLFVLHDFDVAGFEISAILQRDTRRFRFRHSVEVLDLGQAFQERFDPCEALALRHRQAFQRGR